MDLHSYWEKKTMIPGTKSTVSICPLVGNKIEMLTKIYFTVFPYVQCPKIVQTEKQNQWPLKVAVWHLSHGWSQLLQDRVHLLWTWAWPSLVSTSLKLKMTFKFWALRRRLGEVFLVVPLNFSWKYWNHPWPFLTHTNSYCIHLTTLDSLKYSLMSFL